MKGTQRSEIRKPGSPWWLRKRVGKRQEENISMNEIVSAIAGSLVRHLLTALSGGLLFLGLTGDNTNMVLDQLHGPLNTILTAVGVYLAAQFWSLVQKQVFYRIFPRG